MWPCEAIRGYGRSAEINDDGDVAFLNGETVWSYDPAANSFLDVTSLPGAPTNPLFVKLNNNGDIAIFNTSNAVNLTSNNAVAGLTFSGGIDLNLTGFDLDVNSYRCCNDNALAEGREEQP